MKLNTEASDHMNMHLHHPIRRNFHVAALAALLALLPAVRSDAANILWGTPTLITADADVSVTGTLLYAYNFGDTGVPSATVNGVTFAPFAVGNGSAALVTVGSVTLSSGGNTFGSTNNGAVSASPPFSNLSAAYKELLQSGVSVLTDTHTMTLTLGGLTNGTSYQVQFWANESQTYLNTPGQNATTILTAGNAVTLDMNSTDGNGGVGQWVTGAFTATGTMQAITIGGPTFDPLPNGFQVRTVPEPASLGLLGLGAVLLANRRRRSL